MSMYSKTNGDQESLLNSHHRGGEDDAIEVNDSNINQIDDDDEKATFIVNSKDSISNIPSHIDKNTTTFVIPHHSKSINQTLPTSVITTNGGGSGSSNLKPESSTSTIILVVGFYFIISISLVFLNKILMADLQFEYPLFITWYQQIVSFASIYIMSNISPNFQTLSFLPPFEFKLSTAMQVLPLTVVLTCMIIFNNLCLEYVEVSFYQVARSLTICFSLILTYLILKTKTSYRATVACGVVFFGFILGSVGEVNFSWLGIVFGLISSFFVALYSIYVKRVLPVCDGNEWKLSIYNTALSIIIIFPLIFISGEGFTIFQQEVFYTSKFWLYMTFAGVFGYLISISIFMQIKHTSPLTNTISGTVKACVQTVLAVIIWGNTISLENFLGICLVIGGSFWYSFVRYNEMKR